MNIPASPMGAGQAVNGKVSWFGGPHDPTDSGHTASGGTTKEPGIAIYNRATLGGYWRVTAPNGKTSVVKQTDLGPAPFTGRKIDVTYSALGKFGYNEGNFPTNSEFKATYLGHNPNAMPEAQPSRSTGVGSMATPKVPGTPAKEVEGFNKAGFEKAKRMAIVGKLLGGSKENPLIASGLATTKMPTEAEFKTTSTTPGTPAQAGTPAPPQVTAPGGKLGGFLSAKAPLEVKRIDEGQDIQTRPGEALLAPGDGTVIAVKSDPSGFGPDYPVVKFTSGPMAGQSVYLGHTDSALKQGDSFKAGQTIARTSTTGHNAPPGWAEIGLGSTLGQGNTGQGQKIRRYLGT